MIIIRPIQASDYDALHQIAIESGHGFTSLPVNEKLLTKRIAHSEHSFNLQVTEPGDQSYLFVMEDTDTGEVVGTSAIEAAVGLDTPFNHYHLGKIVHSSRKLKIYNTVETLTLCNDLTGTTEICTLFLKNSHRANRNGRFLSRFRFLFIAEHSSRFSDKIIAEMRGVSDEQGNSPFWAWLQEHFFSIDFPTADYLTGIGDKEFIAELMPKHPIYVNLLSDAAQQAINQVHNNTAPALRLLEAEGFERSGYVDIFDAGPTVQSLKHHIETIKHSQRLKVNIDAVSDEQNNYILCNNQLESFRATQANADISGNDITISAQVAKALKVTNNDFLRLIKN
jgi:arginine N-succinyltransferase